MRGRSALGLWLGASGCLGFQPGDPEQPCWEAGYAIAAVTEDCTGDRELANARYEAFDAAYTCIPREPDDPELLAQGIGPEDLYDCAFAIGRLPCAVVEDFGDDIAAYLSISPGCALVTAPAGGGR